jgi:hypothetical protein
VRSLRLKRPHVSSHGTQLAQLTRTPLAPRGKGKGCVGAFNFDKAERSSTIGANHWEVESGLPIRHQLQLACGKRRLYMLWWATPHDPGCRRQNQRAGRLPMLTAEINGA